MDRKQTTSIMARRYDIIKNLHALARISEGIEENLRAGDLENLEQQARKLSTLCREIQGIVTKDKPKVDYRPSGPIKKEPMTRTEAYKRYRQMRSRERGSMAIAILHQTPLY